MITYNFIDDILNKDNSVEIYGNKFMNLIMDCFYKDTENEDIESYVDYESDCLGVDNYDIREEKIEILYEKNNIKVSNAIDIIIKNVEDMKCFVEEIKEMKKIPKQANEENQYRILSFPWCIAGNLLTVMKYLNTKN